MHGSIGIHQSPGFKATCHIRTTRIVSFSLRENRSLKYLPVENISHHVEEYHIIPHCPPLNRNHLHVCNLHIGSCMQYCASESIYVHMVTWPFSIKVLLTGPRLLHVVSVWERAFDSLNTTMIHHGTESSIVSALDLWLRIWLRQERTNWPHGGCAVLCSAPILQGKTTGP